MKYIIKYTINLKNNNNSAEFVPYSDHDKMSETYKMNNPLYCPDMMPFLCNSNSKSGKVCRQKKGDCSKLLNLNISKKPLIYKN